MKEAVGFLVIPRKSHCIFPLQKKKHKPLRVKFKINLCLYTMFSTLHEIIWVHL